MHEWSPRVGFYSCLGNPGDCFELTNYNSARNYSCSRVALMCRMDSLGLETIRSHEQNGRLVFFGHFGVNLNRNLSCQRETPGGETLLTGRPSLAGDLGLEVLNQVHITGFFSTRGAWHIVTGSYNPLSGANHGTNGRDKYVSIVKISESNQWSPYEKLSEC